MIGATLFSGIGAPEQAMPHWRWAWGAEIDPFASAVLAERHPSAVNLGDVSAPDFAERARAIARPDVLVFGSPCQSFSIAGRRLGLDDPRGNLALVALRVVAELRPDWFVFENVPGLMSLDAGRAFGTFLGTVGQLGYHAAWRVLDAQHFGVAQRRARLFVVGHARDWRRAAAVLFEPESLRGHPPPRREAGQEPAAPLASCPPGGSGWRADADTTESLVVGTLGSNGKAAGTATVQDACAGNLIAFDPTQITHPENRSQPAPGRPCRPLVARGHPPAIAFQTRGSNISVGEQSGTLGTNADRASGGAPMIAWAQAVADPITTTEASTWTHEGRGNFRTRNVTAWGFEERSRGDDGRGYDRAPHFSEEIAPTCNTVKPPAVAFGGNNTSGPIDVATARSAHGGPHGRLDFETETFVLAPSAFVRRLTPRECERLQGFPDDYTLIRWANPSQLRAIGRRKAGPITEEQKARALRLAADGPRYRVIGNSMAVPVIRWILSRIEREHRA